MPENGNIVSIIGPLYKPKLMGLSNDSYTLIVTKDQSIFAKVTPDIIKKVIEDARLHAKQEGKGFFGQWSSQLEGGINYTQRYVSMTPEEILKENPANFAILNSIIDSVKIGYRETGNKDSAIRSEWTVTIEAHSQKLNLRADRNLKDELKKAYGELVK
ncbi:MAG: hypothetical protein H5T43_06665 [Methanomethylovorans sp.]|jgi:hypothetical protein|nr:hypothetical protein [Methanomethylovorans sp.]